jgi:hypothetical protein
MMGVLDEEKGFAHCAHHKCAASQMHVKKHDGKRVLMVEEDT